jgi:hypothetical protein
VAAPNEPGVEVPAVSSTIRPTPTDEEAAAIVAAVTMAWPRPAAGADKAEVDTTWRFSGRWWRKPIWGRPQANRQRP